MRQKNFGEKEFKLAVNKVKESLPVDADAWDIGADSTCWKLEANLKPGNNFSSFKLAIEFDKLVSIFVTTNCCYSTSKSKL